MAQSTRPQASGSTDFAIYAAASSVGFIGLLWLAGATSARFSGHGVPHDHPLAGSRRWGTPAIRVWPGGLRLVRPSSTGPLPGCSSPRPLPARRSYGVFCVAIAVGRVTTRRRSRAWPTATR